MKRIIDDELARWASEQMPKPLLLRGARQVGKTYSVRKLAKHFKHFTEVNLDENPEATAFLDGSLSAKPIAEKLSAYTHTPILPGETLLFLDETQACPRALAVLVRAELQCALQAFLHRKVSQCLRLFLQLAGRTAIIRAKSTAAESGYEHHG